MIHNLNHKHNFLFLIIIAFAILFIPSVSAVLITDTTFFSTDSNSTVFVDLIILNSTTVTADLVQFENLISVGSKMTNTNETFDATIEFLNLAVGLTIRNINTSTNLFTSALGSQTFTATFISGHTLQTVFTAQTQACDDMINSFLTYPALIGLVGLMILLGAAVVALGTGFISFNSSSGIDAEKIVFGLLVVIGIGILIIVGIVLLTDLCALF